MQQAVTALALLHLGVLQCRGLDAFNLLNIDAHNFQVYTHNEMPTWSEEEWGSVKKQAAMSMMDHDMQEVSAA
jgi:hypothetical protein